MLVMNEQVAYLGPHSSYTHQAALLYFANDFFTKRKEDFRSVVTIRDVFEAVQSDTTSYGVVPFENSTYGSVLPTLDLLIDHKDQFSDITVCGEVYLPVRHYLLGHRKDTKQKVKFGSEITNGVTSDDETSRSHPLTNLKHVSRIYSHPQAFGQCEFFLSEHFKGVECHEVSSTSKAAIMAAADDSKTTAAISSRLAAQTHELDILAEEIQDREDNATRFVIIRKDTGKSPLADTVNSPSHPLRLTNGVANGVSNGNSEGGAKWKNLVAFRVQHQSGALADVLQVFKTHDLNLTNINSRPSHRNPFHYVFVVEFADQRSGEEPSENVKTALKALKSTTESCVWRGSWLNKEK